MNDVIREKQTQIGEIAMTTSNTEEHASQIVTSPAQEPKAPKKANVIARAPRVAPHKSKAGQKGKACQKAS